jgi:hypothetical protein
MRKQEPVPSEEEVSASEMGSIGIFRSRAIILILDTIQCISSVFVDINLNFPLVRLDSAGNDLRTFIMGEYEL